MTSTAGTARTRADACPGALQTHSAADGELARVRIPGGLLGSAQLRGLAAAARDLGDGALEMTSRKERREVWMSFDRARRDA